MKKLIAAIVLAAMIAPAYADIFLPKGFFDFLALDGSEHPATGRAQGEGGH